MKSTWQFNGIKGYLFGHKMASIRSTLQKIHRIRESCPMYCANCRALHLDKVEIYTINSLILTGQFPLWFKKTMTST